MGTPHATGKNSLLKFFVGGTEVAALDVQSWEVTRNGTEIADGVCGEDRDRLDYETNYFDLSLTCHNVDTKKLERLLESQANDDGGVQPLDVNFGLIIKPKDGSKAGFVGKEGCIGAWKYGVGGRTDRQMLTLPVRVRYFDKAAL